MRVDRWFAHQDGLRIVRVARRVVTERYLLFGIRGTGHKQDGGKKNAGKRCAAFQHSSTIGYPEEAVNRPDVRDRLEFRPTRQDKCPSDVPRARRATFGPRLATTCCQAFPGSRSSCPIRLKSARRNDSP